MSISGPSAPAVRSNVVNRSATGSSVTAVRSNRAASQVRAIVAADPVVNSDLNVVNELGVVSGHSRKLGSLAEFYAAVSECTISGNMYMSRFEFLEKNLHLYNNDKKQFLADLEKVMYDFANRSRKVDVVDVLLHLYSIICARHFLYSSNFLDYEALIDQIIERGVVDMVG